MTSGQTVTIAGLTFTAGSSGATAAQVASAYSSLSSGDTSTEINTSKNLGVSSGGTFSSGTVSSWTSGSPSNGLVSFTSTTSSQNITNLTVSGSAGSDVPTISTWRE